MEKREANKLGMVGKKVSIGDWASLTKVSILFIALIGGLFWLHAPGLGLNWPPGNVDRSADFWGGLLVEAIGISLEIALIVAILDFYKDKRWNGSREKIISSVCEDFVARATRYNLLILTGKDTDRERSNNFTEPDNSLFDTLQFMTSAMTPEISEAVLDYRHAVSKIDRGIPGYIDLNRIGKKATARSYRNMAFDGLIDCKKALDELRNITTVQYRNYDLVRTDVSVDFVRSSLQKLVDELEEYEEEGGVDK